ncbi:MAG: GNAT family N-acetyltransferase [Pseudomonadota bacterium]
MSTPDLILRPFEPADAEPLWPILEETVRPGDTYAIDPDLSRAELMRLWCELPRAVFVAERAGRVLGTYYIKTNQQGGGAHVCNCGYITASEARGLGVARSMCEHSQIVARGMGYLAMQFNFVVSTNSGAIELWSRLGFDIVGRLPLAFRHPEAGLVDALVMYKSLA